MMRQCIERCPDDLWSGPRPEKDPKHYVDRAFWRIAFHGLYFAHLYMAQTIDDFVPPQSGSAVRDLLGAERMWGPLIEIEPYDLPTGTEAVSKEGMVEYLEYVEGITDKIIAGLDLDSETCGIPWYKNISKLSHEMMNIRHLQGHVGQLSELLMLRDVDIDWVGKLKRQSLT